MLLRRLYAALEASTCSFTPSGQWRSAAFSSNSSLSSSSGSSRSGSNGSRGGGDHTLPPRPPAWGAGYCSVRCFRTTPCQRKAEDFELIAPDIGLARIDGLDDTGFVVNDVQVEGSIMLSGDVFTLWRARSMSDVTLHTLSMLRLLKPVPDLLVLGCGRTVRQLPPELASQLHQMGVRVDAMDTVNAVAEFNILNQEGRKVVGALLPQGAED